MSKTKAIRRLVLLSLFIGIEVVLMCTPLGYIPIGAIKATTLHIPVIVISIILGVKEGAILGFVFGMSSLIMSTINPSLFSFCFSPFYSIGDIHGN
ncbi:MAG: ECF transporter S component, partial [Traorella sp.]